MEKVIERLRTVYVALKSRLLVFIIKGFTAASALTKESECMAKRLSMGRAKLLWGGGRHLRAEDR